MTTQYVCMTFKEWILVSHHLDSWNHLKATKFVTWAGALRQIASCAWQGPHRPSYVAFSLLCLMYILPAWICWTFCSFLQIYDRDGLTLGEFVKGDMYIRDLKNTKGHISGLTWGEWHPKTKETVLTSSEDGSLRIWDVNDFKSQKQVFFLSPSFTNLKFELLLVNRCALIFFCVHAIFCQHHPNPFSRVIPFGHIFRYSVALFWTILQGHRNRSCSCDFILEIIL